jgi:hypothetical protein
MPTKSILFALCLITLAFLGCKPKQPADKPTAADPQPPVEKPVADPQPPVVDCGGTISRGAATHKDSFTEFTGSLAGDCLHLKYSYSGGCEEHDIDVYWSGDWAETVPPVTHLYVSHNAKGDACKAIESGLSSFDLTPLRYQGLGQVVVDVHAPGMPLVRINYTYAP